MKGACLLIALCMVASGTSCTSYKAKIPPVTDQSQTGTALSIQKVPDESQSGVANFRTEISLLRSEVEQQATDLENEISALKFQLGDENKAGRDVITNPTTTIDTIQALYPWFVSAIAFFLYITSKRLPFIRSLLDFFSGKGQVDGSSKAK